MAKEDGEFFRKRRFLFKVINENQNKDQAQEKMKTILRRKDTLNQAVGEINNEIKACTILLAGDRDPLYYQALNRLTKDVQINGNEILDYRNYLFSTFPKLITQAEKTEKEIEEKRNNFEDINQINHATLYDLNQKFQEFSTPAQFCHSIYFGYKYRDREDILSKVKKLLELNPKGAEFYLLLEEDYAKEVQTKAAKNYLDFLDKNFRTFFHPF